MPTTTTPDGIEIAYEVTGAGPTLVLVHGLTEDHRAWDPLVPDLATDHAVVAVDMRGHGRSARASAYDPMVMADDIAAVLATAGLVDPLVVGHSMGGIVVTAFAAGHSCRGVINVDQPIALTEFQAMVLSAEPMLRGDGFPDFITALFATLYGPLPEDEIARLHSLSAPVQEVVLGIWGPVLELPAPELDALVAQLTGAVQVPYLALHGGDPGPDYDHWLETVIPTSTVEVWDGSGHYPHLLHPHRFLDRVRAFESSLA
jgi:pimeloyl-ACP methyl ester carboxylesterase